jgi:cytochrome c peroxidase
MHSLGEFVISHGRGTIRRVGLLVLAMLAAGSLAGQAQTAIAVERKMASLTTVKTPTDPAITQSFFRNTGAAIALGKALFWDMNVGSDGKQACATCHFNAGADSRAVNQVSPGLKANDTTFQLGGPNYHLLASDFPIPKATNDVISSAGVHNSNFLGILPGSGVDLFDITADADGFNVNNVNTRKVEPRNTPTTVGAVFNFRNFWDGRAQNECNMMNPFGQRDQDITHHLYQASQKTVNKNVVFKLTAVKPIVKNSSLCSQALGPPLSNFEMSAAGRVFKDLGKKMLTLKPLSQQVVDLSDSRLGIYSALPNNGLTISYLALIQTAFKPQWWSSPIHICVAADGTETTADTSQGASCDPSTTDYSLAEYNFSLFWGLSIQAYEQLLRPDQSKADRFFSTAAASQTTTAIGFGDGVSTSFASTLVTPVLIKSITVQADAMTGEDDGAGNIISETGEVAGTVNYSTGVISLNFLNPPGVSSPVNVTYQKVPKNIFGPKELLGFQVFETKGKCSACHSGPEMTNAAVANVQNQPLERMFFQPSGLIKVYDNGFYNTGVRQTLEDIALGASDPFGNPLSMSELKRQQVCADPTLIIDIPARPGENIPAAPLACNDLINADGTFKTPSIRNVELTAPYFHNGGARTLAEVVDFYDRGGDFALENQDNLDPDIVPLGLTQAEKDALVAFMIATTDPRVKFQRAPFDHPSLMIPNGHPTDPNTGDLLDDGLLGSDLVTRQAQDIMVTIPAVGKLGSLKPLCTFSENIAGVRADGSGQTCP